jgi:RHS repeat-associated protein
MSRKTHPEKRSCVKKQSAANSIWSVFGRFDRRALIVGCSLIASLIATVGYARWSPSQPNRPIVLKTGDRRTNDGNPVKSVSTLSADELAAIPPEALHPHRAEAPGYNASRGGLPPGALPPGVVLPGITDSGRTMAQGYGVYDGVRHQFTGKERDTESGLDYFGARYYSSVQGRFTSPDPRNIIFEKDRGKSAEERAGILNDFLSNPQNWNQYSYVRNNPLAYRDPDGKCSAPAGLSKGNVGICIEAFIAARGVLAFKGDNRDFAANDPSQPFRVQVQGIFTRGHFDWSASLKPQPGITEPRISLGYGLEGQVTANVTSKSVDKEGNFHISLQITGINGFSALTGIGDSEKIKINLNLIVTPDGKVGVEPGSASTNYPSIALYSYNVGSDGKPMANVIFEYRETKPSALHEPLVPIQPFRPSRCPESPGCIKQ